MALLLSVDTDTKVRTQKYEHKRQLVAGKCKYVGDTYKCNKRSRLACILYQLLVAVGYCPAGGCCCVVSHSLKL
jgi:hypothetical protein